MIKISRFWSVSLIALLFLCSCSKNSELIDFVKMFQEAVEHNDKSTISKLYPAAKGFELCEFKFTEDGFGEYADDATEFKVNLEGGKDLLIAKLSDGSLQIKSSHGLLKIPESDVKLAKSTGWVNPKLTDEENAKRLADKGFKPYLNNMIMASVVDKLRVGKITEQYGNERATGWFDDAKTDPMEWSYTETISIEVINDLDCEVDASAYTCSNSVYIEGYLTKELAKTISVSTKNIPAHGSVILQCAYNGGYECVEGMGGYVNSVANVSLDCTKIDLEKVYTPTGHEYEDYLASVNEAAPEAKGLNGSLYGVIGSENAATLSMTGENGTYTVLGGKRTLKLQSHDPSTGATKLQAYLLGKYIGFFDGKWINNSGSINFKGTFTNTNNGVKLTFNLSGTEK